MSKSKAIFKFECGYDGMLGAGMTLFLLGQVSVVAKSVFKITLSPAQVNLIARAKVMIAENTIKDAFNKGERLYVVHSAKDSVLNY